MRCVTLFGLVVIVAVLPVSAAENPYPPGPDSQRQDGVPKGELIKGTFSQSKIFPGTIRDYTIYVPQPLNRAQPAPLMVLQDGGGYRAEIVFDNLIQKKEIPALYGIFVMHGRVKALNTNALDRFNRSYEYDGLGDNYARFLVEELFPYLEAKHGVKFSQNPNDRAIGGASSGAICAFTAAWEHPEWFRRVYSSIGTYVGLRGGNNYPTLIRKTEPKPIRIFLQDGDHDQNIYGGDWWMANQEMERALVFAGYDVNHAWGVGGHDGNQATQVFPDALRWLWRDYPAPVIANPEQRSKQPLVTDLLAPGEDWQLVSEGHKFTEGPTPNEKGEVFFTDIPNNRIHKVALDGKVTVFAENTGGANGLKFGADGRLYACANGKKSIVAYNDQAEAETILEDVESNDIAARHDHDGYFTDPNNKKVWYIDSNGDKRVVDTGIGFPNGVVASPDQSLLYVADSRGQFVYSFLIQPDGNLAYKQRYFHLHVPDGENDSGADGMTVDTLGRLYVATKLGVQICDQAGRVNAILPKPHRAWLSNVCFGGAALDELYITCGDKVFKRKTRAKGALGFQPPVKPPAPRL